MHALKFNVLSSNATRHYSICKKADFLNQLYYKYCSALWYFGAFELKNFLLQEELKNKYNVATIPSLILITISTGKFKELSA